MQLIKFPSIEQYRNTVKCVQHKAQYKGKDAEGNPIIDKSAMMPTLDFTGTVKLHGTNAGVALDSDGNMWCQSRENIITPEKDNAGFAMFAHANKETFKYMNSFIRSKFAETEDKTVVIFGEWCGQGIQKGVAISQLPKMFVIFCVSIVGEGEDKTYLTRDEITDTFYSLTNDIIRLIYEFETFFTQIDFNSPHISQNYLNEVTEKVEAECPVGKKLGVVGVGEGVVWRCITEGYEESCFWFKVKGEKHSNSKVKTLASVDVERINNASKMAERVANLGRLEQMHQKVFNTLNGGETDIKKMGDFIKAVMGDIFKEDIDMISESGLTGKDLNSHVCAICRKFINEKLNTAILGE